MSIEFLKGIALIVPILITVEFMLKDFKLKQKELLVSEKNLYSKFFRTDLTKVSDKIFFNGQEIYYYKVKNKFKNREFYEKTLEEIESKVPDRTKIKTKK